MTEWVVMEESVRRSVTVGTDCHKKILEEHLHNLIKVTSQYLSRADVLTSLVTGD